MLTTLLSSWSKVWWRCKERFTYRQGRTDPEWDNEILALAMVFRFESLRPHSRFIARLGPYVLWVANFPYAAFYKTTPNGGWIGIHNEHRPYKLPSLRTQYFLKEKLERERATWSS